MTRAEALVALLALPVPPDLVGRAVDGVQRGIGYHYTLGRTPLRDPEIIKRDLGTAYVTWRRMNWGPDISCVISVRRQPRLSTTISIDDQFTDKIMAATTGVLQLRRRA